MNIREVVEQVIKSTGSGRSADICAKALLVNFLQDGAPFQAVELKDVRHLIVMMREADRPHVYGDGVEFYFTAHYLHSEDFPVGRSYFIKSANLFEIARLQKIVKDEGFSLPVVSPSRLGALIDEDGYGLRLAAYRKRKEVEWQPFKGFFAGREEVGIVGGSIFLNSPGCLICGGANYAMMTSTMNSGVGLMIGFNLCPKHIAEAGGSGSLIEYLARRFDVESPVHVQPLDPKSHFAMILAWLPGAISATVEKIGDRTLTLLRRSKFKLIVRLDSLSNYAYVIKNPKDEEVARFDSADHHQVSYGPDHLHANLPENKSVRPSFTTGTPMIDVNAILAVLEIKERDFFVEG